MEIRIGLVEGHSDALRQLAAQLDANAGADRVELVHRPSDPEHLGAGLLEFLSVVLGAGGAGTVVAAQVLGWLRTTSTVTLTLSIGEKTFTLRGVDIRQMDAKALAELVAAIARAIEKGTAGDDDD
ncbi:hypothetical protein [Micromonospora sp. MH99]|uniref:effector-associated constant component EACC1 n=1 Tax=Micromonospora sp. MH99 TaxID=1945510 RepID=UPI001F29834D|nr:hypothetical protein [Micromonospora sp. MH99]MCF0091700.1 hypothetical protein [Micromonospora sp. MH99]